MRTDREWTRWTWGVFLSILSGPAGGVTVQLSAVAHNGMPIEPTGAVQALPGDVIEAEIRVSNWADDIPDGIRGYQFKLQGTLGAASGENGFVLPLGWNAPIVPHVCSSVNECDADQVCQTICAYPGHNPGLGTFRTIHRSDYLLWEYSFVDGIFTAALDYLYFGLADAAVVDQGDIRYAGTLILEVQQLACGTFRFDFVPCGPTHVSALDGTTFEPRLVPLVIQLPDCPVLPIDSDPPSCILDMIVTDPPKCASPPRCIIDARIPHLPESPEGPLGIQTAKLTFGGDPTGLTPSSFRTRLVPDDQQAPAITEVDSLGGNTLQLTLEDPIPPGFWTCIEHRASGRELCLGNLPGDVDQSRMVDQADVATLLNNLRRTVSTSLLKDWQCDVDHSQRCTPYDLLSLVDLLAGRGFSAWNGASLSRACPSPGGLLPRLPSGACCQSDGSCVDGLEEDCTLPQLTWFEGAACCDQPCDQILGACCDTATGSCVDNTPYSNCQDFSEVWTQGVPCSEIECEASLGACCNVDSGTCVSGLPRTQCTGPSSIWYPGLMCQQVACVPR